MRYFGGKTRTCKLIAEILQSNLKEDQVFLSPFIGGGWIECLVKGKKECYDKHKYLIAMYKELQKGWKPPKNITKEQYAYIKANMDEEPYLTGFAGFGCSFAGKWFGGYAKDNTNRNFCLNAYNSILRKMDGFKDTKFDCEDYLNLNPCDRLIYCDPPYEGTTQYSKVILGHFDSDEFWQTMREWSQNNVVVISEYSAPEDFRCVWKQNVKLDIRDANNKKKNRVEKLFALSDIFVPSTKNLKEAGLFASF